MANLRMQMRALKDGPVNKAAPGSKALKADGAAAKAGTAGATGAGAASAAGAKKPKPVLLPSSASVGSAPKVPKASGGAKEPKGKPASNFPENVVPELCKYVLANASLGLEAFKSGFTSIHPEIPKRQVELKVQEIFTKSGTSGGRAECMLSIGCARHV